MESLTQKLWNRRFRQGVTSGLNASASTPTSGTTSGANSTGASAASAEVMQYLDSCFDDLNTEDDFKSQIQYFERRLCERAERYTNAGLGTGVGTEWRPGPKLLDLILIAMECSNHVYFDSKMDEINDGLNGYRFKTVKSINASWNGTTKATEFIEVTEIGETPTPTLHQEFPDFPALFIAVRGTQSKLAVDWMVNLNQGLKDATELVDFELLIASDEASHFEAGVHSGFLNAVNALLPEIKAQVARCAASITVRHIIFTGHSAGGAVASLAFLNILSSYAAQNDSNLRFSLITFGCPPVISPSATPLVKRFFAGQTKPGVALAIANEHDPITRADHDYIQSIITLYNSTARTGSTTSAEQTTELWPVPAANLHIIGEHIILKDCEEIGDDEVRAYEVRQDQFENLIFYDRSMHPRMKYIANLGALKNTIRA